MEGKLFVIKDIQERFCLSERTVFRLIERGELTGFKAGRGWRFTEADIAAYIDRQRKKVTGEETEPRITAVQKEEHS